MMRVNLKKRTAIFTAVLVMFIMLASLFFVANEIKHDCTGADCPICACLQQAKQNLKQLGNGAVEIAVLAFQVFFVCGIVLSIACVRPMLTPVSEKVRLNN